MKRLLIAGCGDLGIRLARRLSPQRWTVHGLRRHPEQLPQTIAGIQADLLDPHSLSQMAREWDSIIYQATPDSRTPETYHDAYVRGLENLLKHCKTDRLIFVSSTAVYGQNKGEWVDEQSVTQPDAFSGRILLQAEALADAENGTAVRFSGIYGPGRDFLIRSVKTGQARCRVNPPQWTNRIHAEDCAGVLQHLLELEETESVYCASDSQPAERCEVLTWLAEQLGASAPEIDEQGSDQGKRVSNRRLINSGFEFRYPDFRTGYRELLP
jgi:nucleoside-diphosphate-sugar epimerase